MWETNPRHELVEGVSRAQRLQAILSSQAGDDLRDVIVAVARVWFGKVMEGDPHAHAGLQALNNVAGMCDMTLQLGDQMQAELVRRQGGDHATAARQ